MIRSRVQLGVLMVLWLAGCASFPGVPATAPADAWSTTGEQSARECAALVRRARKARGDGDRASARDLLKQAVSLDPGHGPARHLLGLVCYEDGDLYHAAIHLDAAARLLSDRFEPCYNLACVLEAGGQYEQAIARYEQALARKIDHLETLENLGRTRLKAGYRDAETLRILTRCVERERRPEWSAWLGREIAALQSPWSSDRQGMSFTRVSPAPTADSPAPDATD